MSRARFAYQKLKNDEQSSPSVVEAALEAARGVMRARAWSRLRRVPVRRRFRVRGFGVRLRRFLRSRRLRLRLVRGFKGSWEKVVRRVRESQAHFGDLFAGNYLLLQVSPTPLKVAGVERWCKDGGGLGFVGDSRNPRFYLPRISS